MDIATADRLVQLRKANGLSQESLAALLGVSRQAVSKWERAEASPDTDNLIALAGIYNMTLDQLLDTTNDKYILDGNGKDADGENGGTLNKIKEKGREYLNSALYPETAKKMFKFPYPLLVVIVYLVVCFLLKGVFAPWGIFSLLFLTIPIYYMIAAACRATTKKGFFFLMPVPVVVVTVYLFLGMVFGVWGPAAILFLAIPLYYWFVIFYVKGGKKNGKK